jgi:cell fate regulator YaaT (PSP1 superfamily)
MIKYIVKLYSWENPRLCASENEFKKDEKIIIESEFGNDLGTVFGEISAQGGSASGWESKENSGTRIVRKATIRDVDIFNENEKKKEEILKICKLEIKRLQLEMKLIDARIILDGSSLIIVFTAEERVDFRELVRNLSKIFHRSVKMHQMGSRDEARRLGGCGICGKELCCVRFSGNLPSISTEMARVQKVAHRGSERISGVCGRLMCCLAYEAKQYQEMLQGMPEVGSSVRTREGKGEVLEINVLKQEVRIKMENGLIKAIKKADIS